MLLRRVAAADDGSGVGAGAGRPRLFAVPRLLVGLRAAKFGAPECDSPTAARSPTSPLDLRPFAVPGGSLLRSPRSPRSWDSHRVGLGGLVDNLAEPAADAKNRLLGPPMRQLFKLPIRLTKSYASQPRDCAHAPLELGNAETAAGAGGKPVPCSRSYGDVKSGPKVIVPGGVHLGVSSHSADLGKFPAPGSLPASIGGPRRYIGSVSATEVEQSEDYTCIIAHGPNPKTTRIFGDCILEPITVRVPDGESMEAMEVKEGAESYWLVKCSGDAGEEFLSSSCLSCNKKLDGNDSCIYRGEKASCGGNCKDQEILIEEKEENSTAISSLSSVGSSSSFNDDIFMAGMVLLTGPVDAQFP
ncbi:FCS-Like Zinc finger 10-like [Phragmites australis]|uniref:FCS-Like Zinc finger 10-like n=1 Tax=Phragmites australis TaxID=29695 RepID=UPI002D78B1BD|nr:FCS-Like Zinc finger 10-like [Phragmites australis]XP_062179586.1 FCS-Like Zinc finger 10-like [Phragmites australis]